MENNIFLYFADLQVFKLIIRTIKGPQYILWSILRSMLKSIFLTILAVCPSGSSWKHFRCRRRMTGNCSRDNCCHASETPSSVSFPAKSSRASFTLLARCNVKCVCVSLMFINCVWKPLFLFTQLGLSTLKWLYHFRRRKIKYHHCKDVE